MTIFFILFRDAMLNIILLLEMLSLNLFSNFHPVADFINEPLCGSNGDQYHYYANMQELVEADAKLVLNLFCDTGELIYS